MAANRATKVTKELRIEACTAMLARGFKKGQIKAAMRREYGLSATSVEKTYLPRARETLLERLGRDRNEIKSESLAFYESVLSDKMATARDKIIARKRIDQLLGLDEPHRLEHTGAAGSPLRVILSDEPDADEWEREHGASAGAPGDDPSGK